MELDTGVTWVQEAGAAGQEEEAGRAAGSGKVVLD